MSTHELFYGSFEAAEDDFPMGSAEGGEDAEVQEESTEAREGLLAAPPVAEAAAPAAEAVEAAAPEVTTVRALGTWKQHREVVGWLSQVSKHLSHLEKRAMWSDVLGHEVVRHFGQHIEAFSPPPSGGLGLVPEEDPGPQH